MDLRNKASIGLLIFLIILISTLPIAPFSLTAYVDGEYSPDRVVVGFKIRIPGDFEAKIRGFGGSVLSKNDKINFVIASTPDPDRFIAAIKNIPEVMYAERDPIAYALDFTPNDAYYSSQWGPQDIYAPAAWDTTKGSSSVIIAILDTGVEYTHPDLQANIWTASDGTHGWDFVNSDNNPMDDNGHGTHCAGIAAAVINNGVGIAGISLYWHSYGDQAYYLILRDVLAGAVTVDPGDTATVQYTLRTNVAV